MDNKEQLRPWNDAERVNHNRDEFYPYEIVGFDCGEYEYVRHRVNIYDRMIQVLKDSRYDIIGEEITEETIGRIDTLLDAAEARARKYRRIREPSHGPCCTCKRCGQSYGFCRCDLDEAVDEAEQAKAKLAELIAGLRMMLLDKCRCEKCNGLRSLLGDPEAADHGHAD